MRPLFVAYWSEFRLNVGKLEEEISNFHKLIKNNKDNNL
jgi:hypothetical protein